MEKIKADIGIMLRKLCEYKQVEIIEAEAGKDHIHMLDYLNFFIFKIQYDIIC